MMIYDVVVRLCADFRKLFRTAPARKVKQVSQMIITDY